MNNSLQLHFYLSFKDSVKQFGHFLYISSHFFDFQRGFFPNSLLEIPEFISVIWCVLSLSKLEKTWIIKKHFTRVSGRRVKTTVCSGSGRRESSGWLCCDPALSHLPTSHCGFNFWPQENHKIQHVVPSPVDGLGLAETANVKPSNAKGLLPSITWQSN